MIFNEILRYGVKGGTTLLINIGLMIVFVEYIGITPQVAAIASTSIVIIIGFILMNQFVFPDAPTTHGKDTAKRAGLYYATIMAGKTANYALFLGLLSIGVWYPVAWLVGAGVVFVGLFVTNRYLWHGEVIST